MKLQITKRGLTNMMMRRNKVEELLNIRVVDDSFKIIDKVCKENPEYSEKWKMQKAIFLYAQKIKKNIINNKL